MVVNMHQYQTNSTLENTLLKSSPPGEAIRGLSNLDRLPRRRHYLTLPNLVRRSIVYARTEVPAVAMVLALFVFAAAVWLSLLALAADDIELRRVDSNDKEGVVLQP